MEIPNNERSEKFGFEHMCKCSGNFFENLLSTRKIMRLPVSNQINKKVAQPDAVINLNPANASILGILYKDALSTSTQLSSLGFKQEKKGSSTRASEKSAPVAKEQLFWEQAKDTQLRYEILGPHTGQSQPSPPIPLDPLSLFWSFSTLIIRLKINEICPEVKDNQLGGAVTYLVRNSQIKQFEKEGIT